MKKINNHPEFEIEIIERDSETILLSQVDDSIVINKNSLKDLVNRLMNLIKDIDNF